MAPAETDHPPVPEMQDRLFRSEAAGMSAFTAYMVTVLVFVCVLALLDWECRS